MVYPSITDYNITDGSVLFYYVNDVTTGVFMTGVIVVVWLIICIGGYAMQRRATGNGDFPVFFLAASFVTLVLSVLLRLLSTPAGVKYPLVAPLVIPILIVMVVVGFIWSQSE